jgi:CheY-like chemotaxis protein
MAEPIHILLVDDNPGAVALMHEALRGGQLPFHLHAAGDGIEALQFLKKEGDFKKSPRPDLILLDLDMPRMNGRQTLEKIKDDPDLRRIPVIILTSSDAEADVAACYDRHANCYITKPLDLEEFTKTVREIENFWMTVATLPTGRK